MDLRETMRQRVFVVVGDTLKSEKYAYKIKHGLLEQGYTVYAVGKELQSINDVPEEIDVLDLCIHPVKGLALLKENQKAFKNLVIQPGAESPEILEYLEDQKLPHIEGCLLVGMRLYGQKKN